MPQTALKYNNLFSQHDSPPNTGVNSIIAGNNIIIDNTDPNNPIISTNTDDIIVVNNYSALPSANTVSGKFYWCENSQGTRWLPGSLGGTYYSAGLYYSNGSTWEFIDVPYQATQATVNTGTNNDQFITPSTLNNYSGWNKTKVGLGNVDNTSDVNKPVSTAQLTSIIDNSYFTISGLTSGSLSPADATTYYFGAFLGTNTTIVNTKKIGVPLNCILIGAIINTTNSTSGASNESSFINIRINNTTDYLISNSISFGGNINNTYAISGLSQSLSTTDQFEIKWQCPNWSVNPTTANITMSLLFKRV